MSELVPQVAPYVEAEASTWDDFVRAAVNGTFLHTRRFLRYHGTRFADRSLVIRGAEGEWLGVLPCANDPADPARIISHPGATFGGIVHMGNLTGGPMVQTFAAVLRHFTVDGAREFAYRPPPFIYHRQPAADDLYAAFRHGGRLTRRTLAATIDLNRPFQTAQRRTRTLRKAEKAGVRIVAGADLLPSLWPVVEQGLLERHGARAVHTLSEIQEIQIRFPDEVQVLTALLEDCVVGGVVLFNAPGVVHVQYSVVSSKGQSVGAMDALIADVVGLARDAGARYLDFGISTNRDGSELNEGLHRFKVEFGGGGVCYEEYSFSLVGPAAGGDGIRETGW
jgi:hypothetical protein